MSLVNYEIYTEGYWKKNIDEKSEYPFPEEGEECTNEEFLEMLEELTNEYAKCTQFRGYSMCRLCKQQNGTEEFTLYGLDCAYIYPEGLFHYYEDHNVKPSNNFVTFIRKLYLDYGENLEELTIIKEKKIKDVDDERKKQIEENHKIYIDADYKNEKEKWTQRIKKLKEEKFYEEAEKIEKGGFFYMDSEERRRFAQVGHEYMIQKWQEEAEKEIKIYEKQEQSNKENKQQNKKQTDQDRKQVRLERMRNTLKSRNL